MKYDHHHHSPHHRPGAFCVETELCCFLKKTRLFLFSRQMLAKFAEDDRIEYMNAQKRRMKQLEHQRAVERLLEERRDQLGKQRVSFCCSLILYIAHL